MKWLVLALMLLACRGADPSAQTLEQRLHQIDELGTPPDDWVALFEIAAGEHHWNGKLDPASELTTRCHALARVSFVGAFMPPLFIGSVYRRYSARLDDLEGAQRILRLLDDLSRCDRTTIAESTRELIEGLCAFPSLRGELERRHLDRAVANIDHLVTWHPSAAADRIEQAVALGDVAAFHRTIVALANTSDADRASVSDTGVAAFDWLVRLLRGSPELSCCGPLESAIADGKLGEEFVERLAVEPDREIRRLMWHVLETQPRPRSAARLREIADNEKDADVKFEAEEALKWAKVGGTRVHDQQEHAKKQLEHAP